MAGYLGASPVPQTIQKKQSFTATASQTTFTTTGYTDGQFINVYLNGVRLINGTDYTATNGSDIVLTTGASASDVLDFETFNEFTLVDQDLTTPTLTGATLKSNVTLKNDTEEDTDGGRESTLIFKGEQSGGEISTLAEIQASHDGTADDEKGDLIFRTNDGSDGSSPTERLRLDSVGSLGLGTSIPASSSAGVYLTGGGATYSTSSTYRYDMVNAYLDTSASAWKYIGNGVATQIYQANGDFVFNNAVNNTSGAGASLSWVEAMRIKETAAHGAGLGIGTTAPLRQLHISNTSANSEIAFTAGTSGVSSILFGDGLTGTDVYRGYLQYNHSDDAMLFASSATERMRLHNTGVLKVGVNPSTKLGTSVVMIERNESYHDSCIRTKNPSLNTRFHLDFHNSNGTQGNITCQSSSVAYNSTSDYRKKENVNYTWDGITDVKLLKPAKFNFIGESDTIQGFLAHEAATVVPQAVTGTHNQVEVWREGDELPDGVSVGDNKLDDDGNTIPVYQSMDSSKLVPLLTKALQEAIAKIETLKPK